MTAQVPDRLIHRGRAYSLCALPLEDYLKRLPKARRPAFRPGSTANWRGYRAVWEIADGQLFLVGIEDAIATIDGTLKEVSLADLFPHRQPPVKATWVTDWLRCPEGRLRSYVHAGFASTYERDRLFEVERGEVCEEWLRYNPPAPLHYLIAPDGSRRFATIPGLAGLAPEDDPFPAGSPVEPWRLWGDPDWGMEPDADPEGYMIGGWTEFR